MNATTNNNNGLSIELLAQMCEGRKLNADTVNNADSRSEAHRLAEQYVTNYDGTFEYIVNMKRWVNSGLSDGQVAGVLNTATAEYKYQQRRAGAMATASTSSTQPIADEYVVADGYYTIVGPKGGHRTLHIQTVEDGNIKQWLSYLCGQDNTGDYKSVGFVIGSTVTLFKKYAGQYSDIVAAARFLISHVDSLDEYGRQYAIRSGKCYRCNRMLTTPESVAQGLGPVCAGKV